MKVLLVQVPLCNPAEVGPVFPLGLCYIGTALEAAGHVVEVLDLNLHTSPYRVLEQRAARSSPNFVGLSLRNIDTTSRIGFQYYYLELGRTIAALRRALPEVPIVIGGAGFSLFSAQIMARHPSLAFGVYQEGETTICDLLDHLDAPETVEGLFYRRGDVVFFTGPRKHSRIDSLPRPRRDFVEVRAYDRPLGIGVQSQRGCPLDCAYCSYPILNGRKVRGRTADDVVDEIEELVRDHDVNEFIFADSLFNIRRGYATRICELLMERKLRVRWSAWFDVLGFDEEFLVLARDAGCYRMSFSPDAATNRTMRALGKRSTERDLAHLLNLAARHPEVEFRFTIFCTPPEQDLRDILLTVRFLLRAHVVLPNSKCLVSWARVLPGTKIHEIAVSEGVVAKDAELLPETTAEAQRLFYASPTTAPFATPLFSGLVPVLDGMRSARKVARTLRKRVQA